MIEKTTVFGDGRSDKNGSGGEYDFTKDIGKILGWNGKIWKLDFMGFRFD